MNPLSKMTHSSHSIRLLLLGPLLIGSALTLLPVFAVAQEMAQEAALGSSQATAGSTLQETIPQAESAQDGGQSAKADRGEKRLLHMRDGRVLRVRAREVAAAEGTPDASTRWEVRKGRDWIALAPGSVQRVTMERDALKAARKLEAELKREEDLGRHVAYASWLLEEGLLQEAATKLAKVLESNPDQPLALALIERLPIAVNLPAIEVALDKVEKSVEGFCRAASRSDVLGTELAVRRLGTVAEQIPDLEERLVRELHNKSTNRRAFAARALRRLFRGEEVRPLLRRAILDSSSNVRHEASLALRDVGDEAVLSPAIRALSSKQPAVREHAVQAMATMGYAAAVEPLVNHLAALQSGSSSRPPHANVFIGRQFAYVQDYDVEVAQGSAVADPIINVAVEGAVLDAAILGTSQMQTELAATRRALGILTGAKPGNSSRAWRNWWSENGSAWRAAGSAAPRTGDRRSQSGSGN
ncbi:MAG: tetratricopeptide (TPR) repeat protein [Planctomycetota bacterium]|jgi:tetratricopeptide (TPR) repeat protein